MAESISRLVSSTPASGGPIQRSLHPGDGLAPLTINGLWALEFGAGGANNGKRNHLFFTAGIADEAHGLFGFIHAGRDDDDDRDRD